MIYVFICTVCIEQGCHYKGQWHFKFKEKSGHLQKVGETLISLQNQGKVSEVCNVVTSRLRRVRV